MDSQRRIDRGLIRVIVVISMAFLAFLIAPGQDTEDIYLNALFFAVQTVTTTGYGAGFVLNAPIKVIACIFMLWGAASWAVFIAELTNPDRQDPDQ